ncbi:helicase-related protein [Sulfurimonas sp. HSL3-7]|uniref:helicase-related protein n=1 Tax=Sulfonitrofixus jiaomeiensis TaxID=3131938 RepID=UPI0031FA40A7
MPEQTDQPTEKIYNDPISVAKRTRQKLHLVAGCDKAAILAHIIKSSDDIQTVVITKTKRDADALSIFLKSRSINAAAIHGNKRTQENEAAAKAFGEGKLNVLITTDMILQSLGLSNIARMVSYDLPTEPENYLSRLGCLSETGEAIALVTPEEERERFDIERVIRQEIPEEEVEGFVPEPESAAEETPQRTKDRNKKPRHRKQKRKRGDKAKEDAHPEEPQDDQ